MRRAAAAACALTLAAGAAGAGCGGGDGGTPAGAASPAHTTTQVEVVHDGGGGKAGFNASGVYRRDAPSVVTVVSVFPGGGGFLGTGPAAGQGSGFVVSTDGGIATNAHVVTTGSGRQVQRAGQVFVIFGDGNQVPAKIVGYDLNADVALLHVDPAGLHLHALTLGTSTGLPVGAPVAAIGSPFNQEQSLSVGVISATNRSVDSLTGFQITGAIQTDAAINHGNSGGPLLDAGGRVIGINQQIKSDSGGGEGVGFAVPVDLVKRSLAQLRQTGNVRYAYLGVSSAPVYPQLSRRFNLGAPFGAWVQTVVAGGPGAKAGLRGGSGPPVRFQIAAYKQGGDVIVGIGGQPVRTSDDLGTLLESYEPGQDADLQIVRAGKRRTVTVHLGERPNIPNPQQP